MKSYVYLQDAKYEGMLEGKLEGRQEGRQEDRAEAILELLDEIGPVPQELSDAIMSECNMDVLKKWHKISAKAQSIDEFIEKSGIKIAVSV
jgi:predicted transposase YdaD